MENILTQHIEVTPGVVGGKPRIKLVYLFMVVSGMVTMAVNIL